MSSEFAKNLPKSAKKWYANAIAGAITSDGQVDKEELEFLEKAIGFLETKEDIYELVSLVKNKQLPELAGMTNIDRGSAFRMIVTITTIVANDGKISKGEAAYLKDIVLKLGFEAAFSAKVLEWAVRNAQVRKEFADLKRLALNS